MTAESKPQAAVRARTRRPITPYLRSVGAVVWKDIRAEMRSRELINSMILFTIMTVLIFSLALELDAKSRRSDSTVAGILWVTIAFAGILGLGRSMASEKDRGSLDALLLAPIARSALFFGKMLSNLLFVLVVAVVLMFLLTVLFDATVIRPLVLLMVLLGSIGFTTVGTLVSSMSVHARARETLLPILLLPVVLPVLISAVRGTNALLNELPSEDWMPWLQLLVIADLLYLAAAYWLFDFIVEE